MRVHALQNNRAKFEQDLAFGGEFERYVADILAKRGNVVDLRGGMDFDLIAYGRDGVARRVECKLDAMAQETGNLFFEQTCSNRASGVFKMHDLMVYGFNVEKDAPKSIYPQFVVCFDTVRLRIQLGTWKNEQKAVLRDLAGDGGRVIGYTVPIEVAMSLKPIMLQGENIWTNA